jgi:hypothetical protein
VEWINHPFDRYKAPYKVKEKVFLSADELKLLEARHFKIQRLELVRDSPYPNNNISILFLSLVFEKA